jgi:TRAP-type mannitol/chloroaromatic compound transport system permease small subunit
LLAWEYGEKSHEAGGLPFVYLLKTLIVVLPILLIIQAVCNILSIIFSLPLDTSNTDSNSAADKAEGVNI